MEMYTQDSTLCLHDGLPISLDFCAYWGGDLKPVYFGSAVKWCGVDDLLAALALHAPGPQPQPAEPAPVRPDDDDVTGFVFKVQANMNPEHRDRIAFMPQIGRAAGRERVCQ